MFPLFFVLLHMLNTPSAWSGTEYHDVHDLVDVHGHDAINTWRAGIEMGENDREEALYSDSTRVS